MSKKLKQVWSRIETVVAVLVALLGLAYFVSQALVFADSLPPVAPEEGMNLYKGYLFASGRYQPYEDYSPWISQMPLAYLLPGLVQDWFGAGMYLGRMYAVAIGGLAVIGLWLAARRNANAWWAALVVWVIALNPTYVQLFSQARTEALVSMLLAWMLAFGLGAERQDRELFLAAFLAGLAGMTHLTMLLVLPLYVIYVFWQFDQRAGWLALLAGLLPVVAIHLVYWPEVLRVWANMLPAEQFSWVGEYQSPVRQVALPANFHWWPIKTWIRNPEHLAWQGIEALGQAVRVNFVAFFGTLTTILLWPWRRKVRPGGRSVSRVFFNQHKQVVFLMVTFLVLFGVSIWNANGRVCLFTCLPGDVLYYFVFGLALVPVAAAGWQEDMVLWKQGLVLVFLFLLLLGLEFNFNSDYLDLRYDLVRYTFDLKAPQWQDGKLVEGTGKVWEVLENKFGFNHFPLRQFILKNDLAIGVMRYIKVLGFLIVITPLAYLISEKFTLGSENYGTFMLTFTLLMGVIFSGSRMFGGFMEMQTCEASVITSYQQAGNRLNRVIPEGSQLYWDVKDDMLLLYLPKVEVFTPQLSASYTYLDDPQADPDFLYRFGWWNPVLKEQWLEQADLIVLENQRFDAAWQARLDAGQYKQLFLSPPAASCRGDASRVMVLEPVP